MTDADGNIAQHIEYIPYGEVFVEERNNSFSTNYLFNAKELDNETGLYYYGARYLDPTGAMWLSVDPLFEKYAGMSPYNYCMGNPVKLVDPDGREVTDEFEKMLKKAEQFAADKLKDPSLSDAERREFEAVSTEADKLRNSDQLYDLQYKDLVSGTKAGDHVRNAYTTYDPKNDKVVIVMNDTDEPDNRGNLTNMDTRPPMTRAGLAEFAHEAKHCFQFEVGLLSFTMDGNGAKGHLYDYVDEKEAHYRGFLFGASSKTPDNFYYYYFKGDTTTERGMNSKDIRNQVLFMYNKNKSQYYFRYLNEKGEKYKTYKPSGK